MARFTHPAIEMSGSSANGTWAIEGGTLLDPQPTFSGNPQFVGDWVRIGNLCHFEINVDMSNITSFGTGQYYMKVPFVAHSNIILSDGCLHDDSTGDQYAIMAHIEGGTDVMTLMSIASNGKHVPFTKDVPVNLAAADTFHIAGIYHIAV